MGCTRRVSGPAPCAACLDVGTFYRYSLSLPMDLVIELHMARREVFRSQNGRGDLPFKQASRSLWKTRSAPCGHEVQAQYKNAPRHVHHGMNKNAHALESRCRISEPQK